MRTGKYRSAKHIGGLKECLETEQEITKDLFDKLTFHKIYEFYGYDERIGANRYILVNHNKNLGFPTWLHEYIKKPKYKTLKNYLK